MNNLLAILGGDRYWKVLMPQKGLYKVDAGLSDSNKR